KYLQKHHLTKADVNTATSREVQANVRDLEDCGHELGYPFMLKARKDAYDGRGGCHTSGCCLFDFRLWSRLLIPAQVISQSNPRRRYQRLSKYWRAGRSTLKNGRTFAWNWQ